MGGTNTLAEDISNVENDYISPKIANRPNKNIHVGMASAYFAIMRGGGEYYTLYLSNELAELGYEVTVVCGIPFLKKPAPLTDRFLIEYVPQLYFLREIAVKGVKPFSSGAWILHTWQYQLSCYNHLLNNARAFNLIHTHDPASLRAAVKLKKKYGVPVVCTFHGFPSSLDIKWAAKTDAVFSASRSIASTFRKFGISNVHFVPVGVDFTTFKPIDKFSCKQKLGLHGKVILFVGRLVPIKNLYTLLNAFKLAQQRIEEATLVIVGDGVLADELKQRANSLGISEKVLFSGTVPHSELSSYYNAADVFVLPSFFESFSLVALEALACNLPLVVSTGADALIKEFGTEAFFVADPHTAESFSDAIVTALSNEVEVEKRQRISMNKVTFYDWKKTAAKVAKIYELCLIGKK